MQSIHLKNILITGARSYTAQHLISYLKGSYNIALLTKDNYFSESAKNALARADCIIHLAHSNDHSTNTNLCEHIVAHSRKSCRIIHLSSIAVYGKSTKQAPIKETATCAPNTPNGQANLLAEKIINQRTNSLILRVPQLYGDDIQKYAVGAIYNKLKQNEPIEITDNGELYRDFIHIKELVKLVESQISKPTVGTYNLGTGQNMTLYSFTKNLKSYLNSKSSITCSDTATKTNKWAVPDITKAKKDLDFAFTPVCEVLLTC